MRIFHTPKPEKEVFVEVMEDTTLSRYMDSLYAYGMVLSRNSALAGGQTIGMEGVTSTSANLTPDASGIPYYDEALFIRTSRTGTVGARELSSIMPFVVFRNLSDDDLKAIFAYLQTLKPVRHRVDNSLPPTYCRLLST